MAVNTPYKDSTVTTTNHTANYDLPLWTGEDTTSWLTQMNDAMNKIDDGMVDAKSKALEVVGIAADAKKLADETKAESAASAKIVAGYNDRLTAAEEKIVEHTQDITNLNTRSDQFDVELHSVQEVQKKTTADLATLAEKVASNKTEVDSKITELTETVTNNKTSTDTKIQTLSTSVASIQAKDVEQDGKIETINTEITSLDGRVTTLENSSGGSFTAFSFVEHKDVNLSDFKVVPLTSTGTGTEATNVNLPATVKFYRDGTVILKIGDKTQGKQFSLLGSEYNGYSFQSTGLDLNAIIEWLGLSGLSVWVKYGVLSPLEIYTSYSGGTKSAFMLTLESVQISDNFIDLRVRRNTEFSGDGINLLTEPLYFIGKLETT